LLRGAPAKQAGNASQSCQTVSFKCQRSGCELEDDEAPVQLNNACQVATRFLVKWPVDLVQSIAVVDWVS